MSPATAAVHMARALRLAERGRSTSHPNPSVGCVIVRDGRVVGEGFHARAGQAHAEPLALVQAGELARGADLFVTLEPCSHHGRTPPCADAVIAAGVRKVWAALQDPNPKVAGGGLAKLRAAGIDVDVGLMQQEAKQVHRGYLSRMTRGRPFLTLKLGASLDGRTAMASGESQWITSAEARADVHRLRAQTGAVLTGVATVMADDPQLNARDVIGEVRQPDRVVIDSQARAPAKARVWAPGARRLWMVGRDPAQTPPGVEALRVPLGADDSVDLASVLSRLAECQVNEALLECGPRLSGAFLQQGLVDEIVTYVSPTLLGHDARPFAYLPGLERLSQRLQLQWLDVRQIGPDLKLTARPITAPAKD